VSDPKFDAEDVQAAIHMVAWPEDFLEWAPGPDGGVTQDWAVAPEVRRDWADAICRAIMGGERLGGEGVRASNRYPGLTSSYGPELGYFVTSAYREMLATAAYFHTDADRARELIEKIKPPAAGPADLGANSAVIVNVSPPPPGRLLDLKMPEGLRALDDVYNELAHEIAREGPNAARPLGGLHPRSALPAGVPDGVWGRIPGRVRRVGDPRPRGLRDVSVGRGGRGGA
jgi:hypothetical protein